MTRKFNNIQQLLSKECCKIAITFSGPVSNGHLLWITIDMLFMASLQHYLTETDVTMVVLPVLGIIFLRIIITLFITVKEKLLHCQT